MPSLTGRAAFLRLLAQEGVTHLFGNPGVSISENSPLAMRTRKNQPLRHSARQNSLQRVFEAFEIEMRNAPCSRIGKNQFTQG